MKVNVLLSASISAVLVGFILASTIPLSDVNASSTQGVPKNELAAEWEFEKNVKDTSGNHHNGVISGDPEFLRGKVGKSLSFDGNYEVVTVANSPALNFGSTDSFSISLWVKSTQSGTGDAAFGWLVDHRQNNDGVYSGYSIGDYSGIIEARIRDSSAHDVPVYSGTNVNDGKWHHVVFVVDRDTQKEKLYIDNALEDRASISSVGDIDTAFDLHLGGTAYPSTPIDFLDGRLDQVRIYDHALSKSQIERLFEETIS